MARRVYITITIKRLPMKKIKADTLVNQEEAGQNMPVPLNHSVRLIQIMLPYI